MKETLYEENNNNNVIELKFIDQNPTSNPLKNEDYSNNNDNNKTQELLKEDKQEFHNQKRWRLYNQSNLLSIIPQKQIRAYAFDLFKLISQQYRKYFSFSKAWSITAQVLFIYLILMFIFLVVISIARVSQIQSLLYTQSNMNYYTSIIREMIDAQRDVKVELDKLNNLIRMKKTEEPNIFMQIYTNELMKHNILQGNKAGSTAPFIFKDIKEKNGQSKSLINKGFALTDSLKNIVEDSNQGIDNYKHLIPFYYHFTPILYRQLENRGLELVSMYYVAFPQSSGSNPESCKSNSLLYFKYPLEISGTGKVESKSNTKPTDVFIDPISKCEETINDNSKKYNWFYSLLKEKESYQNQASMIKFYHIHPESLIKEEYLMNYRIINQKGLTSTSSNNLSTMLFALKLKPQKRPFINFTNDEDTLNFDYLSIINLIESKANTQLIQNAYRDLFREYDLDEKHIVYDIPKFVNNIYYYATQPNKSASENSKSNEPGDLKAKTRKDSIQYSIMDKLRGEGYLINYYFKPDTNYFQLLVFLNQFFLDFKANGNSFKYTEYAEYIQENGIDCINDFCYFNECKSSSQLYIDPMYSQYMPNCYCLPLYSQHSETDSIPNFHSKINEAYPNQPKGFYSYDFKSKESSPYFDKEKGEFNCRMNFMRKSSKKISSFNSKIYLQNISSYNEESASMLLMFLLNNDNIDKNIKDNYDEYIDEILWALYLIYAIFLCVMIVTLTYFMHKNVLKLTIKMKKFEEYRKKIIPITDNCNHTRQKTNTENQSSEDEESQLFNFKAFSLIRNLNVFKNKDEEEDELDKLMKLISNNIDDFKIDFSINGNINDNIREIQKQYQEMNKINDYKSKFFLQRSNRPKKSYVSSVIKGKENIEQPMQKINFNDYGLRESKDSKENYSLNLLYEMLSMSDKHLLDFNSLKPNFYHIEDTMKSFINFSALDEKMLDNNESYSNEITDIKKIDNGIQYYIKNIHSYWKKRYNHLKDEEKKSPQANYI